MSLIKYKIANFLWLVTVVGLIFGVLWIVFGLILCLTIYGIPSGVKVLSYTNVAFFPYGKEIIYHGMIEKDESIMGKLKRGFLFKQEFTCAFVAIPLEMVLCAYAIMVMFTVVGFPFGVKMIDLASIISEPFKYEVKA